MLGREIKTLVTEHQIAGAHSVVFEASELASGVYFYRILAGKFLQARKMLMIK